MIKKKIIFFLQNLNGGGAERVSMNIINLLDKDKYEIHLVLVKKKGAYLNLIPSYVKVYELGFSKTMFSVFKLRKKINELQPDIIYSTLFRTHIAVHFALQGLAYRPKTIFRMQNSPKLVLENKRLPWIQRVFLEKALKHATKVIAQTPQMKEEVVFYHKVMAKKIEVFINPLDTKLIQKSIEGAKNPFDDRYINVVASGRVTYQKGYDILIKAFNKVSIANRNYKLFIIGETKTNKIEECRALVKKYHLEDVVHFLGFQSNPYVYYLHADLFVLSSRWEGLPNVVLESLYLNKPVVGTRCISFMETLIDDGKNGFLVDVEDSETLASKILDFQSLSTQGFGTFKLESTEQINHTFDI